MPGRPLFDDVERTDGSPGSYGEDSFSFLNRVSGSYWEKVRTELERWYALFPDVTGDLRARFRKAAPDQHYGSWWELYLHRVFTQLGFQVTPNTALPGGRSHPDLLVENDDDFFYVEATTVFSGMDGGAEPSLLEPKILDVINTIDASNFFVGIDIVQSGPAMPRRSQITTPIAVWLREHDPDDVLGMPASELPGKRLVIGDWVLELKLIPRSPEFRGRPGNRLVGMHGGRGGWLNDRDKIYRALERKKRQHKTPDGPMVIAVMAINGFVDNHDFISALFGSEAIRINLRADETTLIRNPDGFWIGTRSGPASKKVSAVLTGVSVIPTSCVSTELQVWHHFDADRPLTMELPFASVRVVDDELSFKSAEETPSEIIGLPAAWPGPDPRFWQ